MPLDALCLSAVAEELRNTIIDSRIDKIQQPEKDVFLFSLRGSCGNVRLLISAGSGSARVHLTEQQRENPKSPPMFCMLLRKHLAGAKLIEIVQPELERVYQLRFACLDEMGLPSEKTLAVEMLGRGANVILVDGEGRIIDCLRKVDSDMSEKRQLLPGMFYRLPPKTGKRDLYETSPEWFEDMYNTAPPEQRADAWLVSAFAGISPLLAREAVYAVSGSVDSRLEQLEAADLMNSLSTLFTCEKEPYMLLNKQGAMDIYCLAPMQYERAAELRRFDSFSELLDSFYTQRERMERIAQRSQSIVKTVKNRRDRAARKLTARSAELLATENREQLRRQGDIIKANIYRMSRGMSSLKAEDFYSDTGEETEIPLDVRLTPQQNAAKYYKAYSKAKNAAKVLGAQLEEAQTELEYLDSVLEELSRANGEKDIEEVRQELITEGYIREAKAGSKKRQESKPVKYHIAGADIYVGKNNMQNDRLTLRIAEKHWLWFHAQKIHGSHVVADCGEDNAEAITAAAGLAAYYSKARSSSNVPVDYTKVKYVKKPAGAKAGMVIYTDYKTIYVTPKSIE